MALVVSFIAGKGSLPLLFVVQAICAEGAGIQTPAVGALLPKIVPKESLTKANAAFGSVQPIIMLIAPMSAGALMSFASIEALFFVDVITAAIAVSLLLVALQEKVDPAYLGRVFGVLGMVSGVMWLIGMLVFGPVADAMRLVPDGALTGGQAAYTEKAVE